MKLIKHIIIIVQIALPVFVGVAYMNGIISTLGFVLCTMASIGALGFLLGFYANTNLCGEITCKKLIVSQKKLIDLQEELINELKESYIQSVEKSESKLEEDNPCP